MKTKMIYQKRPESTREVVWLVNAYKSLDGKLKAIIMHDPGSAAAWKEMPYEEVRLNRLRPMDGEMETLFSWET